jgi:hypothetical protein
MLPTYVTGKRIASSAPATAARRNRARPASGGRLLASSCSAAAAGAAWWVSIIAPPIARCATRPRSVYATGNDERVGLGRGRRGPRTNALSSGGPSRETKLQPPSGKRTLGVDSVSSKWIQGTGITLPLRRQALDRHPAGHASTVRLDRWGRSGEQSY